MGRDLSNTLYLIRSKSLTVFLHFGINGPLDVSALISSSDNKSNNIHSHLGGGGGNQIFDPNQYFWTNSPLISLVR